MGIILGLMIGGGTIGGGLAIYSGTKARQIVNNPASVGMSGVSLYWWKRKAKKMIKKAILKRNIIDLQVGFQILKSNVELLPELRRQLTLYNLNNGIIDNIQEFNEFYNIKEEDSKIQFKLYMERFLKENSLTLVENSMIRDAQMTPPPPDIYE